MIAVQGIFSLTNRPPALFRLRDDLGWRKGAPCCHRPLRSAPVPRLALSGFRLLLPVSRDRLATRRKSQSTSQCITGAWSNLLDESNMAHARAIRPTGIRAEHKIHREEPHLAPIRWNGLCTPGTGVNLWVTSTWLRSGKSPVHESG